ncbi:30S ribosomal protein S17 [Candidatus Pacearchaeota archaeon]|nr:30S ribosomal protein S17 [Candidatus Pacearchaeota archaeon]
MKKQNTKEIKNETKDCNDGKCPIHGSISVRGKYFTGKVSKVFAKRIVIDFERVVRNEKYERFSKLKTRIHAYLPECMNDQIKVGDLVKVGETRRMSKIIHFVLLEKIQNKNTK